MQNEPEHHRHRLAISTVGGYTPAWLAWVLLDIPGMTAIAMCSVLAWWLWRHL